MRCAPLCSAWCHPAVRCSALLCLVSPSSALLCSALHRQIDDLDEILDESVRDSISAKLKVRRSLSLSLPDCVYVKYMFVCVSVCLCLCLCRRLCRARARASYRSPRLLSPSSTLALTVFYAVAPVCAPLPLSLLQTMRLRQCLSRYLSPSFTLCGCASVCPKLRLLCGGRRMHPSALPSPRD